jgi:hypothetical protein
MCRHCRLLTEKQIFSPAYYYAIGTSGNTVKYHIISAVLWLDYLPIYIPVCLFLYIKLGWNYNPPVEFANEASQFQCKFWEKHDITVQPVIIYIYLCVQWYAASLSYFFKPSNWNVIQALENLYIIGILSYTDCWCLVHFSSNMSCNRSHKVCFCFGYRIKTECNISVTILQQQAAGYTVRKFCYKACRHN